MPPALATWAQEVLKCQFTDDTPQDRWGVPGLGAAKEPLQTGHPTSSPLMAQSLPTGISYLVGHALGLTWPFEARELCEEGLGAAAGSSF